MSELGQEKRHYLDILQHNNGFSKPERWVDYARIHDFRKVRATHLDRCPDCSGNDLRKLGHYIYYSTLIRLESCQSCGLIFSDQILDDRIFNSHFEQAYKDKYYFEISRHEIFLQISKIISDVAPHNAKVIDIGGAQGHLMDIARKIRPDLSILINDISPTALMYAKKKYRLDTRCCSLSDLANHNEEFDVVSLIDVLYYARNISNAYEAINQLCKPGGYVIVRIPNKLWIIKLFLILDRLRVPKKDREIQDKVRYFNPEHLFIFSKKYMRSSLQKLGMSQIKFVPSEMLRRSLTGIRINRIAYLICALIYYISFRMLILTPSQLVIAKKV